MLEDETLAAATAVVRSLGKGATPIYEQSNYNHAAINGSVNGFGGNIIRLPGSDNATKRAFERELSALQSRIQYLEAKASTINAPGLPDTPNELGVSASPFDSGSPSTIRNGPFAPIRNLQGTARNPRVSHFLTARDDDNDGRQISGEDLRHIRNHVQKQAEEIQTQKETILDVSNRLHQQEEHTKATFSNIEHQDISQLQRELQKHQQANEAFQKALKEIGSIITNVANGDLRHKVLIHSKEMDPEITTFKQTVCMLSWSPRTR